ncbi:MAG: hypothetical protein KDD60_12865 [Bdellovibrionales bacterium]|nr:hypothetical protein [Bdellovibrionales bacterium]
MASKKKPKAPPLESGLKSALKALDSQIAREMLRTPDERSEHGVLKFEPYSKRVEDVTALLLQGMADQQLELDGILVLAQALAKTLHLWSIELSAEGLGAVRTEYCITAAEGIKRDAERCLEELTRDRAPVVS